MTRDDLINAGYKRYPPSPYSEFITDLFEKCVRDEFGKRYFIHVTRWNFSAYEREGSKAERFEADVQFCNKENNEYVNIEALDGWDIEDVEKFYEKIWDLGWFKYYEVSDAHRGEVEAQY